MKDERAVTVGLVLGATGLGVGKGVGLIYQLKATRMVCSPQRHNASAQWYDPCLATCWTKLHKASGVPATCEYARFGRTFGFGRLTHVHHFGAGLHAAPGMGGGYDATLSGPAASAP